MVKRIYVMPYEFDKTPKCYTTYESKTGNGNYFDLNMENETNTLSVVLTNTQEHLQSINKMLQEDIDTLSTIVTHSQTQSGYSVIHSIIERNKKIILQNNLFSSTHIESIEKNNG